MSLAIDKNEAFTKGWKRVVEREARTALALLRDRETGPHDTVHEVRKSFKKIRAALRLVRFRFDDYSAENAFFRDEARKLSDVRDATSIIEAFGRLTERYGPKLRSGVFSELREGLEKYRKSLAKGAFAPESVLEEVAVRLEKKHSEIPGWEIGVTGFAPLREGLRKVYRRGYGRSRQAMENPSTEVLHEWRKRAKYLRYQFRILDEIWPNMLSALEDEMHTLTDYLGEDHDLAVLLATIDREGLSFGDERSRDLFRALVQFERQRLQGLAIHLGAKLYADSPEVFCDRMEAWWKTER